MKKRLTIRDFKKAGGNSFVVNIHIGRSLVDGMNNIWGIESESRHPILLSVFPVVAIVVVRERKLKHQ